MDKEAKRRSGPGTIRHWFDQKWVDVSTKDPKTGRHPPCGRKSAKKGKSKRGYPKCVPAAKAGKLSASEKKKMTKRKRATKPAQGKKPTYTSSKTKKQKKKKKKKRSDWQFIFKLATGLL